MKTFDELAVKCSTASEKVRSEKGFKPVWFTRQELKRFSALMIEEVIEVAKKNHREDSTGEWDRAVSCVIDDLKKHFGS